MEPHPIEIRYSDLDTMGHVHNAVYLSYFEEGRMSFFKQHLNTKWDWRRNGIIVARNEIDYLRPLLLNENAFVAGEIGYVGNKSFTMKMRVFVRTSDGEFDCAKGVVTLVCFDHEKHTTIPVPNSWRVLANN